MAAITAAMVKELRETSGAGMMDCKRALAETSGDMEAAMDWLRAKGIAKAAKKSSRVAAEGLIGAFTDGARGTVIEVNSETDFVARNADFQEMVAEIGFVALDAADMEVLSSMEMPSSGKSVTDHIADKVGKVGENMSLRRMARLDVGTGVVGSYVHNAEAPNLGKIGVLVGLESTGDTEKLAALGKQLAMHVAANSPASLDESDLDPALIEREKQVLTEQARESGKPENVIEKMIEGRMRKFLEEVCLVKQAFVLNPDLNVEKAIKEAESDIGGPIKLTGYIRFGVGEGIEKEETDFAAEVAAAVKGS